MEVVDDPEWPPPNSSMWGRRNRTATCSCRSAPCKGATGLRRLDAGRGSILDLLKGHRLLDWQMLMYDVGPRLPRFTIGGRCLCGVSMLCRQHPCGCWGATPSHPKPGFQTKLLNRLLSFQPWQPLASCLNHLPMLERWECSDDFGQHQEQYEHGEHVDNHSACC